MKLRYSIRFLGPLLLLVSAASPAAPQSSADQSREKLLERVQQLEAQFNQIKSELSVLRETLAATSALPSNGSAASAVAATPSPTRRSEIAGKKEVGIALGPWRAVPYGTLYFNAFGNSGGSNNTDIPTFATTGTGNASVSVRQTRVGLRLSGPELGGAALRGVVEADFFGGFPPIGVGENFTLLRLRLAYGELEWQHARIVLGQDWTIFAPNNPLSIANAAIPQLTSAGNLWARLPQARLDLHGGQGLKWLWQSALLAPASGDFPGSSSAFLLQPGAGARSRVPYFESRVALTLENWLGLGQPATFGASVQYGRARVLTTGGNRDLDSVGSAFDWDFPLFPHATLQGETFFGRNLAGFQGAIFQGINADFALPASSGLVAGGPRAIGTRGGWVQFQFVPSNFNKLTLYGSFGLDYPRKEDLVSLAAHDWRLRNEAFSFGFLHKPVGQFTWGIEFRRLETDYLLSHRTNDNHINAGVAVSF